MRFRLSARPWKPVDFLRFTILSLCFLLVAAAASPSLAQDGVNHPPTLNQIPPVIIPEDSPTYTVHLIGISAGDEGQGLEITAASSAPTIIPDPAVTYTSPEATGSLAFTPLPNQSGVVTITVTVKDDGGTANGVDTFVQSFLVTVIPVNDPPVVSPIQKTGVRGQPLAFSAQDFTAAYSDIERAPLFAVKFLSLPGFGSLTLDGVTVTANSEIPTGQLDHLVYTPATPWFGTAIFAWTASDGQDYALESSSIDLIYPYTPLAVYLPFISGGLPWTTRLSETFEGAFPGDWRLFSRYYDAKSNQFLEVTDQIAWGKRDCQVKSGQYAGWAMGGGLTGSQESCLVGYRDDMETWMLYGPVDLSQAKDALLTLKIWTDIEDSHDFLGWGISKDGENFYGKKFTGNSQGWLDQSLDFKNVFPLGDVTGSPQVWIGIWFSSDEVNYENYAGAAVDDILLSTCPVRGECWGTPALNPAGLQVTPASQVLPGRSH